MAFIPAISAASPGLGSGAKPDSAVSIEPGSGAYFARIHPSPRSQEANQTSCSLHALDLARVANQSDSMSPLDMSFKVEDGACQERYVQSRWSQCHVPVLFDAYCTIQYNPLSHR
jgi:hypothetical protein